MTDTSAPTWLPSWDGRSYAANTGHHRAHDGTFLAAAPIRPSDRLLDLGCGAGDLTADVAALVPDGHVVGVDPQPSMLAEARRVAHANQSFVQGTAQRLLDVVDAGSFDGVISRAALQWVPMADHPGVLANVFAALRPGGWFRLDMGGYGNIPALLALMDDVAIPLGGSRPPWAFPDAATSMDLVERAGFDHSGGFVRTVAQRRPFDEASILGWLRTQGFTGYLAQLPPSAHAAFTTAVEARLDDLRRHDGTLDQTFVRLDALVHRPAPSTSR
jgi:trans-aconitate methyltransferase